MDEKHTQGLIVQAEVIKWEAVETIVEAVEKKLNAIT